MTFGLFLIQLSLKFRCHFVVSVLSFFQRPPYLMNISECIQVFMLIHWLFSLPVWLFKRWLKHYYFSLSLFIYSLVFLLFFELLIYCIDKILLHFYTSWNFRNLISWLIAHIIFINIRVIFFRVSSAVLTHVFAKRLLLRLRFRFTCLGCSCFFRLKHRRLDWLAISRCFTWCFWTSSIWVHAWRLTRFIFAIFLCLSLQQVKFLIFSFNISCFFNQFLFFCFSCKFFSFLLLSLPIIFVLNKSSWVWNIFTRRSIR